MRYRPSIHDMIDLPPDTYLVVRPKGAAADFSQLLYMEEPYLIQLLQLPGSSVHALVILANYGTYQHTSACEIAKMMRILGVSQDAVYKALQKLKKADIIRKVGKDTYRINPNYIWKGSTKERLEAIKQWDTPYDPLHNQ